MQTSRQRTNLKDIFVPSTLRVRGAKHLVSSKAACLAEQARLLALGTVEISDLRIA
jgi:hypothetical protein